MHADQYSVLLFLSNPQTMWQFNSKSYRERPGLWNPLCNRQVGSYLEFNGLKTSHKLARVSAAFLYSVSPLSSYRLNLRPVLWKAAQQIPSVSMLIGGGGGRGELRHRCYKIMDLVTLRMSFVSPQKMFSDTEKVQLSIYGMDGRFLYGLDCSKSQTLLSSQTKIGQELRGRWIWWCNAKSNVT